MYRASGARLYREVFILLRRRCPVTVGRSCQQCAIHVSELGLTTSIWSAIRLVACSHSLECVSFPADINFACRYGNSRRFHFRFTDLDHLIKILDVEYRFRRNDRKLRNSYALRTSVPLFWKRGNPDQRDWPDDSIR